MLLLQTMQLPTSYYKNKLKMYLHSLTDREQQVLILRFGLKDGKPRTLEEVGQHFNVTP